jgi:hypothetical protein
VSQLVEIADALAASLGDYAFTSGPQPEVSRVNWPTYDAEDMRDPIIAVTAAAAVIERVDRTHHQYDYQINVFIGRHTPTEALANEMFDLAEEMTDAIRAHVWDDMTPWPAGVTSPFTVEMILNPDEALQDRNVWRAVVTVGYRVFR